ncbi:MAG: hypothetical protein RR494_13335 [Vagococcus sp.]|uniref:hypothetical protein n=1 Tax=Lactobacillales TaxID=186826 RepID=UPI002FCA4A6B
MLKETVIKEYFCDLCEKEVDKQSKLKSVSIPVKFTTEQTEGRSCTPYLQQKTFELCESCIDRVVAVGAYGAQGHNTYYHLNKK